ncbi:MAG: helix-turn-helix domain-containing protein [Vicinamibacterales bacterium]
MLESRADSSRPTAVTSTDKALDVCEVLSRAPRGLTLTEVARALHIPASSAHRILGVLRRRGYVRQDDDRARYSLSLKMLDLMFRALGGSELRLHAYPLLRDYVLRTSYRMFLAMPGAGEVAYFWTTGPDEVAMRTVHGREMPGHCALYFQAQAPHATRRLSCLKLNDAAQVQAPAAGVIRLGPAGALPEGAQRLVCSCAPIRDYTAQEVGRVGAFAHGADEAPLTTVDHRGIWDLARNISVRLGFLPSTGLEASA